MCVSVPNNFIKYERWNTRSQEQQNSHEQKDSNGITALYWTRKKTELEKTRNIWKRMVHLKLCQWVSHLICRAKHMLNSTWEVIRPHISLFYYSSSSYSFSPSLSNMKQLALYQVHLLPEYAWEATTVLHVMLDMSSMLKANLHGILDPWLPKKCRFWSPLLLWCSHQSNLWTLPLPTGSTKATLKTLFASLICPQIASRRNPPSPI